MKDMKTVPAEERLGKVEYNNYSDWDTYPRSVYECPFCQKGLSVSFKDLEKHSLSEYTNLSEDTAKEIDNFANTLNKGTANSFLDFLCQGCHRPVRIYYTAWAGGRHGEAGFQINFIIESKV
ncbi:MAG: hypothetical protein V2B19_18200 [Pseudomonadota bacterium]